MLESTVLRSASGSQIATGDRLFVRYEGKLNNGSVFDANFSFTDYVAAEGRDLFSFVLGQNQVIQGWEIGLKGARLGQVLKLVIPPELAYGDLVRPGIPANSTLEFTVEVVGVSKGDRQAPVGYELKDLGIRLDRLGLSDTATKRVAIAKFGTDLNDAIVGSGGIDLLTGLGGANTIGGGLAADLLISTVGLDTFIYNEITDSPAGKKSRDVIAGFRSGDKIDLSAFGEDLVLNFIEGRAFGGIAGEVRFSGGVLSLDLNGDRRADFEIGFAGKAQLSSAALVL